MLCTQNKDWFFSNNKAGIKKIHHLKILFLLEKIDNNSISKDYDMEWLTEKRNFNFESDANFLTIILTKWINTFEKRKL